MLCHQAGSLKDQLPACGADSFHIECVSAGRWLQVAKPLPEEYNPRVVIPTRIGGPDPFLGSVEFVTCVQPIFVFATFHKRHCLFERRQSPVIPACKVLLIEIVNIGTSFIVAYLSLASGMLPGESGCLIEKNPGCQLLNEVIGDTILVWIAPFFRPRPMTAEKATLFNEHGDMFG